MDDLRQDVVGCIQQGFFSVVQAIQSPFVNNKYFFFEQSLCSILTRICSWYHALHLGTTFAGGFRRLFVDHEIINLVEK